MLQFIMANSTAIVVALLAISEVLAAIPSIKANSIFQLIVNTLTSFKKPA